MINFRINIFFNLFFFLIVCSYGQLSYNQMIQIGDIAPKFIAESTKGKVNFPIDFKDKWVIFFSHPSDFTPVCKTEFKRLSSLIPEFDKLNTKLIGISADPEYMHQIWLKNIEESALKESKNKDHQINFPVISDVDMKVAKLYNMVHPKESDNQTIRAVYFIDPKGKIRAIFYYPLSNGRNFDEIKRLLVALQISDKDDVATPSDWQPGKPTISKEEIDKGYFKKEQIKK